MPILLLSLLFLALPEAGLATVFPALTAPTAYVASIEKKEGQYELFLRLRDRDFFVLHERMISANGKKTERSLTGTWRQVGEGALLQLTSRDGIVRRLNVGGTGDLYGDIMAPRLALVSAVFKQTPDRPRPFMVSGILQKEGNALRLRDGASNRVLTLSPHSQLESLGDAGSPLFVRAEVEDAGEHQANTVRLVRLLSTSPQVPDSYPLTPEMFAGVTDGGIWRVNSNSLPPLSCAFSPEGENAGNLDIFGRGLHVRVPYRLKKDTIAFHADARDASRTLAQYAPELERLLRRVRTWDVEGGLLVLSSGDEALCVLERRDAPRARASGGKENAVPRNIPHEDNSPPLWTGWSRK